MCHQTTSANGCQRAKLCPDNGFAAIRRVTARQRAVVRDDRGGERVARDAAQFGQGAADIQHAAGLVARPPVRHRREVRRIGFDQQPVERHARGGVAD